MRAHINIAVTSLWLTLVLFGGAEAQTELDVRKSAIIYNIIRYRFIEWPIEDSSGAFIVAVLGESSLLDPLRSISSTETLSENRMLEVIHWRSLEDVDRCNILFISSSMEDSLDAILRIVEGKNWLTVSDTEGFAARGVAINFVRNLRNRGTLDIEINRKASDRANLRISSQFLSLGILVDEKKREDE